MAESREEAQQLVSDLRHGRGGDGVAGQKAMETAGVDRVWALHSAFDTGQEDDGPMHRPTLLSRPEQRALAARIASVAGVVGVTLGGSRARGTHWPDSDVDLGIYYDAGVDLAALRALATEVSDRDVELGPAGSWGPWVDTGAWLEVGGVAVDWILRDLGRVRAMWVRAQRGEHAFHLQPGHPFGFWDVAYVGELATAVVLADPRGVLAPLHHEMQEYPTALREAVVAGLWQPGFEVEGVRKSAGRGDAVHVALCLAHAVLRCAHAHHAWAGVWVTNEKGLVPAVASLPHDTGDFSQRAQTMLAHVGQSPEQLRGSLQEAERLVAQTRALLSQD